MTNLNPALFTTPLADRSIHTPVSSVNGSNLQTYDLKLLRYLIIVLMAFEI